MKESTGLQRFYETACKILIKNGVKFTFDVFENEIIRVNRLEVKGKLLITNDPKDWKRVWLDTEKESRVFYDLDLFKRAVIEAINPENL